MSFDTVVRGGTIDVAIADGVIAEVAPGGELGEGARDRSMPPDCSCCPA